MRSPNPIVNIISLTVCNCFTAAGANRLFFLLDPTSLATETPGFYQDDDGEIAFDDLGDFADFFKPLNKALISRLESAAGD